MCPDSSTLAQLADGELDDAARLRVEEHLDACIACSHVLAALAKLVVPGVTLRAWLDTRPAAETILATWRVIVSEVAALHADGRVHGALSPEHVVMAEAGELRLLAPRVRQDPAYRAVELLHGATPSHASDQFALCVIGWEALTGKRPFAGATVGALAVAMTVPPTLPREGPRATLAVILRGLAADPAERWPSVAALHAALDRPPRSRHRVVFAVLAALAIVGGLLALVASFSC